jgi:hypothetical protein
VPCVNPFEEVIKNTLLIDKVAQVSSFCGGANVLVPQLSRPMIFVAGITWPTAGPKYSFHGEARQNRAAIRFVGMSVDTLGIEDARKGEEKQG